MPKTKEGISPEAKALGARFAKARSMTGKTQAELAAFFKVQNSQVSRWERGENEPNYTRLSRLATLSKCDLHWLVTGDGSPEASSASSKKGKAAAPNYASLDACLGRHARAQKITDEEVQWLSSMRFPERLGDIGDDYFWLGILNTYRGYTERVRAMPPGHDNPPDKGRDRGLGGR